MSSTFPPGAPNRRYQFADLPAYPVILKLLTLKGTGNNANNIFPLFHSNYASQLLLLQLIPPIHFNFLSKSSVKSAEEYGKFFLHKHVFAYHSLV